MPRNGYSTKQDQTTALKLFLKSADMGDSFAQCNSALMITNADATMSNPIQTEKYYKMALEQGHPAAQRYFAEKHLQNGEIDKALEFFQLASQSFNQDFANRLKEVQKNEKMLKRLFDVNFNQNAELENNLDELFQYTLELLEGKHGFPKNLKRAREIFEFLSSKTHWPSKFFLGWMISKGLGGWQISFLQCI